MEQPKVGEVWKIEFGLENKSTKLVVVENVIGEDVPNWRCRQYICTNYKDMVNVDSYRVDGECFIERF